MPIDILVATPDQAFGEWLCDSLATHGHYSARLVRAGGDVLVSAASIPYALAILDADLKGEPFVPLARSLQTMLPRMKMLVIPPDNDPRHPAMTGLKPDGYLTRPFYFPDFMEMLGSLLPSRGSRPAEGDLAPLVFDQAGARHPASWLEDQTRAQEQLARLLLETNAQAGLITTGAKVWANAGSLGQAAALEVAARLAGCFDRGDRIDVARYIRLDATGGDYMLFATAVISELALGLLYPASTPLSQARSQAAAVAQALIGQINQEEQLPDTPAASPQNLDLLSSGLDPEESSLEEEPQIDLSVLLAGMPSPDPGGRPLFPPADEPAQNNAGEDILFPWEQSQEQSETPGTSATASEFARAWDARVEPWTGAEEQGDATTSLTPGEPDQVTRVVIPRLPGETQQIMGGNGQAKTTSLQSETVPLLSDAHKETAAIPRQPLTFETLKNPASAALINDQTFTFLLLPTNPEHLLTDEVAEQLSRWLPNLCQAFGWRLQSVILRPGYLQLIVRLAPAVSPNTVVRILRQRSSERIFNRFPEYIPDEAGTDFWASEHLVASGPQPPSIQAVRDFIQRTRRRQGYSGLLA